MFGTVEISGLKKEEITEDDPLSDTNSLMSHDTLEVAGTQVKQDKIEDEEQIPIKEEPEYEEWFIQPKVEMLES